METSAFVRAVAVACVSMLGAVLLVHCGPSQPVDVVPPPSGGNGGSENATGGSDIAGLGGMTINLNPAGAVSQPQGGRDAGDAYAGDAKAYRCDDAGNCNTCLAILSLGQPGQTGSSTGDNGDTAAFQTYMNTQTNAKMTMLTTFTSLTDSLLNQYDVVILQALEDNVTSSQTWTYQASDIAALERWVNAGGAIIAMSGYGGNSIEVKPLNQLLSFSGITYGTANTFTTCPDNLCSCADGSIPFNNWLATYADNPAITHDLKKVGIFYGRPVNCSGSTCQVFAADPSSGGGNVGVAQVVGNGRIFAWGDEWVTYTSQWGLTPTQWDNASTYPQCAGHTAESSYSVPQFWNNAFKWVAPNAGCFTITQPSNPNQQIIP
ncbi:MAG: hypothetical protein WBP56_26585 [Polyangia bacterium]|jgi:hypothetical protein